MLSLPGYQDLSLIYESANSEVYRAVQDSDNRWVILKTLKQDTPMRSPLNPYQSEYAILSSLDCPGVVKAYHLIEQDNLFVLVLEDFEAESLEFLMKRYSFSLIDCLKVAITIASSIEQVHHAHLIHKNINPGNIVLNRKTRQLKLIDFGMATYLSWEKIDSNNLDVFNNNWAYISPEQTGRSDRCLDYRTDFYSLGVTCYALLTRKLPFVTNNSLDFIHCLLNEGPVSPSIVNPTIPLQVSAIILKLMAKNPENRYQSGKGVKADLETCVQQLQTTGKIESFALGSQDRVKSEQILPELDKQEEMLTELITEEAWVKQNLDAAMRAKNVKDYRTAEDYLQKGLNLLTVSGWQTQYELTFNFHLLLAEIAYEKRDFPGVEREVKLLLQEAKSIIDRAKSYHLQMLTYIAQDNLLEAIAIARDTLQDLGIEFQTEPDEVYINQTLEKVEKQLNGRVIKTLVGLPKMSNPAMKIAMQLLEGLAFPVFLEMPTLSPLVSGLMVNLSLQFGNTLSSPLGYGLWGTVMGSWWGESKKAYEFGKLAFNLVELFNILPLKSKILWLLGALLQPYQDPLKASLVTLKTGYLAGWETGALEDAGYNLINYLVIAFWGGTSLGELEAEIRDYQTDFADITDLQFQSIKVYVAMMQQVIFGLTKTVEQPDCLLGQDYDESRMIPHHYQSQELAAIAQVYCYKLMLAYTFGHYRNGLNHITQAMPYLMAVSGTSFIPIFHFYAALTYLALYESLKNTPLYAPQLTLPRSSNYQSEVLGQIETHQNILQQWSNSSPHNYRHKWLLVEAERQRILGNKDKAIDSYDRAIALAQDNGDVQDVALANELAAKFYYHWRKDKLAEIYFQQAQTTYQTWGAKAKVRRLEQQYPQLFALVTVSKSTKMKASRETVSHGGASLDLAVVMRANQAIAREMILENLLETLMKILSENVGSTAGCLLLHTPNSLGEFGSLAIAIYGNDESTFLFPETPIAQSLPEPIIERVAHTLSPLILNNPSQEGEFCQNTYIKSVKPLSVLCYPLLNQGSLVGVVYLENTQTAEAFAADRIEFLQLLSGQVAISITNVQLYSKLRKSKEDLQQFLDAIPIGIGILDNTGHPYYVNHKGKSLMGKGVTSEATTETISEVYHNYIAGTNELYPNEQLPIIRALNGQVSGADDIEIHQGDRIIPVESWGTPIYNDEGLVEYAMVTFQDITKRKQTEKILSDYNHSLEKQVKERTLELQELNQELSRLANLDGLTQIANRRHFDDYLAQKWQQHLMAQQPLALMLVDIDYFKTYNDCYGHLEGDQCLIEVAQAIAKVPKRSDDLVARYGGEEFVVILANTNASRALIVAEGIRMAIAALQIPHARSLTGDYITLSLGISSLIPSENLNSDTLISQADKALYMAKEQGRDRAVISQKPNPSVELSIPEP